MQSTFSTYKLHSQTGLTNVKSKGSFY